MDEYKSVRKDKKAKDPKMGMKRHGKSGHVHSSEHFTGKKSGKKKRRKKKRNGKPSLTRKQRKAKKYSHQNKYKNSS